MGYAEYGISAPGYRKVASNLDGENTTHIDYQALKAVYNINEHLTLTSVTTHRIYNSEFEMDWDFTSATLLHNVTDYKTDKLAQELRLDSSSGRFNWLIGLYYDKDHYDDSMIATSDYPSMAGIYDREIDGNSYSAFGHISYSLTEKLSLIGGLRYEKQESELEDYVTGSDVDKSWSAVTPKIAIEYNFTPSIMAYANVAEGYRSGGFNSYANDPRYYSFDSESLWSYEAGIKSSFLNDRVTLNGALYYMDISDMQVTEAINPVESWVTNAAEASSTGGELEFTARMLDGLTVMAGLGISDIEFDSFQDTAGNYKGNKTPYSPDYTYNIGVQYRHASGIYMRSDLVGYGKMYFDKSNDYSRDSYQVVNAKIGYETESFDVYLYAKNLFDEVYDSDGHYSGYYIIYSEPREAGLQLVYRF